MVVGDVLNRPPQSRLAVSECVSMYLHVLCFSRNTFIVLFCVDKYISHEKPHHLSDMPSRETSLPCAVVKPLNTHRVDTECKCIQIVIL